MDDIAEVHRLCLASGTRCIAVACAHADHECMRDSERAWTAAAASDDARAEGFLGAPYGALARGGWRWVLSRPEPADDGIDLLFVAPQRVS